VLVAEIKGVTSVESCADVGSISSSCFSNLNSFLLKRIQNTNIMETVSQFLKKKT
jgi:hypothetical protein